MSHFEFLKCLSLPQMLILGQVSEGVNNLIIGHLCRQWALHCYIIYSSQPQQSGRITATSPRESRIREAEDFLCPVGHQVPLTQALHVPLGPRPFSIPGQQQHWNKSTLTSLLFLQLTCHASYLPQQLIKRRKSLGSTKDSPNTHR